MVPYALDLQEHLAVTLYTLSTIGRSCCTAEDGCDNDFEKGHKTGWLASTFDFFRKPASCRHPEIPLHAYLSIAIYSETSFNYTQNTQLLHNFDILIFPPLISAIMGGQEMLPQELMEKATAIHTLQTYCGCRLATSS